MLPPLNNGNKSWETVIDRLIANPNHQVEIRVSQPGSSSGSDRVYRLRLDYQDGYIQLAVFQHLECLNYDKPIFPSYGFESESALREELSHPRPEKKILIELKNGFRSLEGKRP